MGETLADTEADQNELLLAQTQVRDLKDLVEALRKELENTGAGNARSVQQAVAEANDQMVQLRDTARALRDELEEMGFSIAAYPHSLILRCIRTIQKTLTALKETGTTQAAPHEMADFNELDELIGFPEARAWEARYSAPE